MQKYTRAYLYNESTVVLEKSAITNAKDEDFKEVTLLIPAEQIKDWYEELDLMGELEDEEDEVFEDE